MEVIHTRSRGSSTICLRGTTVSALDQHIAHSVCRLSIFCYWKDWGLVASNGAWGDATEMKKEIESISMNVPMVDGIPE